MGYAVHREGNSKTVDTSQSHGGKGGGEALSFANTKLHAAGPKANLQISFRS